MYGLGLCGSSAEDEGEMRGNNGERGVHGALGKYSEGKGQEQSEVEKSFGDSTRPPKVKPLNHKGRKTEIQN